MSEDSLDRILEYCIENDSQLLRDFVNEGKIDADKVDADIRTYFEQEIEQENDRWKVVERLCTKGAYELAYEFADDDQIREEVITAFVKGDPIDALVCGTEEIEERALEQVIDISRKDKEGAKSIFEAYARLRQEKRNADRLWEEIETTIIDLKYFGEIHQKAIETDDRYTMNIIAQELAEDSNTEGALEEALVLAYECKDYELQEQLEERLGLADLTNMKYANLLDVAYAIIEVVEEKFGIKLPKKVQVGGPAGSYAAIRYSKFGGKDVSRDAA